MPPPRRLKKHELQTQPFIPPKRKPGDPPWMYGNDIPESYLRKFTKEEPDEDVFQTIIRLTGGEDDEWSI